MTYASQDSSVHDGEPVEVFKFTGTLGTFRYVNDTEAAVVNGETYEPLQVTRSAVEVSSLISTNATVDLMLPVDSDVAVRYGGLTSPEALNVEIRRVHRGNNWATDFALVWIGEVLAYERQGRTQKFLSGSKFQSRLQGAMGSVYYQTLCNHVLFDVRCKVSKASFTTSAVITLIGLTAVTLDNDDNADHALKLGEIVNTRTGERRLIVDNLANVVTLAYGFLDVVIGDTVSLTLGCDHAHTTCIAKFSNIENFGGFLYIPTKNPFDNGI